MVGFGFAEVESFLSGCIVELFGVLLLRGLNSGGLSESVLGFVCDFVRRGKRSESSSREGEVFLISASTAVKPSPAFNL